MTDSIKLLYIDLFCGAGGTSTGVEQATLHGEKCAHVVACVNHDPNAIRSHAANHPGTQSEQKKFIGNAVEVNQSRVLCEALAKVV